MSDLYQPRVTPTWTSQLQRAHELSDSELARHARISWANRHGCRQCFTCAAAHTLRQRAERQLRSILGTPRGHTLGQTLATLAKHGGAIVDYENRLGQVTRVRIGDSVEAGPDTVICCNVATY